MPPFTPVSGSCPFIPVEGPVPVTSGTPGTTVSAITGVTNTSAALTRHPEPPARPFALNQHAPSGLPLHGGTPSSSDAFARRGEDFFADFVSSVSSVSVGSTGAQPPAMVSTSAHLSPQSSCRTETQHADQGAAPPEKHSQPAGRTEEQGLPAKVGTADRLNLLRMVRNNPDLLHDADERMPKKNQNTDASVPSEPSFSVRALVEAVNKTTEAILKQAPVPSHQQSIADFGSLAIAAESLSEAMSGQVTSEGLKKKGKISIFQKIFSPKKKEVDNAFSVNPDDDFEPVNIKQSDVDKVAAPVNGPVNLRKPFDYRRWVTNSEEIVVYRQDQRSLHEIVDAGGFYPRTLEIGTLEDHAQGSTREYSFVSTSEKRIKGGSYGKYEYKIRLNPYQAVHLPATLDRIHGRHPKKYRINEYSVPGFITPLQIIGWRKW